MLLIHIVQIRNIRDIKIKKIVSNSTNGIPTHLYLLFEYLIAALVGVEPTH